MLDKLPKWIMTKGRPTIYDTESATVLEMTSKLYGKMNELIESYNDFEDSLSKAWTEYSVNQTKSYEEFKMEVRQNFQDLASLVEQKLIEYANSIDGKVNDSVNSKLEAYKIATLNELIQQNRTINEAHTTEVNTMVTETVTNLMNQLVIEAVYDAVNQNLTLVPKYGVDENIEVMFDEKMKMSVVTEKIGSDPSSFRTVTWGKYTYESDLIATFTKGVYVVDIDGVQTECNIDPSYTSQGNKTTPFYFKKYTISSSPASGTVYGTYIYVEPNFIGAVDGDTFISHIKIYRKVD